MKHLVTPRLLMRLFVSADLPDLHALHCDLQEKIPTATILTPQESSLLLEKMIRDFEENEYGMYAVIERKEKRFIGKCGLQPLDDSGLIQVDFAFVPGSWGKGYATEATMEILRAAFSDLGLEKVVAITSEENRAATRVMQKIGMTSSGRKRFSGHEVVLYTSQKQIKPIDSLFQSSYHNRSRLSMPAL